MLGNGVEKRGVDHSELGDVIRELFRIVLADEHVAGKKIVPRARVHDADGDLIVRVGAGIAILHEEVPTLEVGRKPRFEPLEVLRLERLGCIPPNLFLASRLADDVFVVGRAARVLTRLNHERAAMRDETLASLDGVLVERRSRKVPPN